MSKPSTKANDRVLLTSGHTLPQVHLPFTSLRHERHEPISAPLIPRGVHPITYLMKEAEKRFDGMMARQSRTLEAAVAEYKRRYGRSPPKGFEIWWVL